jgi:hypothetical protein
MTKHAPYIKNREALLELVGWLMDDAPTVTFDILKGVMTRGTESGEGVCGTICCIAGAAAQMHAGVFGLPLTKDMMADMSAEGNVLHEGSVMEIWQGAPQRAIEYLDIDLDTLPDQRCDQEYILDLFSDAMAPSACTGYQAAQAVINFDETGDPRWKEIEEQS